MTSTSKPAAGFPSPCFRNAWLSLKSTLFFTVGTRQGQPKSISWGCPRSVGWLCFCVSGQLFGLCRGSGPWPCPGCGAGIAAGRTHIEDAGLWPYSPAGQAEGHQGSRLFTFTARETNMGSSLIPLLCSEPLLTAICHLGFFQTFPRCRCK